LRSIAETQINEKRQIVKEQHCYRFTLRPKNL